MARAGAASDYGLAQCAGSDRAALNDPEKAVRLHHALSTPTSVLWEAGVVRGPLQRKQIMAAALALDLLRRYLQGANLTRG